MAIFNGTWAQPDLRHFFALTCLLSSIGNLHGFVPHYHPQSYVFLYGSIPHITKAAQLYLVGSLFLFGGLWLGYQFKDKIKLPPIATTKAESVLRLFFKPRESDKAEDRRRKFDSLFIPEIVARFNQLGLVGIAGVGAFLFFIKPYMPFSLGLGDSYFFTYAPYGIIFFLARQQEQKSWWLAFGLVILFTIRNVLFAYLRMEMILPSVALILGVLTAGKLRWTDFLKWRYIPLYGWFILFILAFPWMINNRGKYGTGMDRIRYIQTSEPVKVLSDKHAGENVITRLSLLNQLSQVVRIAEEDGLYYGKTLSYWKFIFIPRVLWPSKPKTATGAWFAHKLDGTATKKPYVNTHSWSANMTIPGELFLNFGWWGVLVGCTFIGYFAALLWHSTQFWKNNARNSVWSNLLAYFLIMSAIFYFGADLQFLVNMIAFFILTLMLSNLNHLINAH